MNDKSSQDFIKRLIAMLRVSGAKIEEYEVQPDGSLKPINSGETNPSKLIHSCVDMGMVRALEQWFESQSATQGQVFSCLAFMLANEIYQETDSDEQACTISTNYERYIHQTVHILRDTYGPPKKVNDVEK